MFAAAIARRSGVHSRWWMLGVPLIRSLGVALWGFAIGVVFLWLRAPQMLPYVRGLAMLTIAAALFAVSFFWHRSPEPDART